MFKQIKELTNIVGFLICDKIYLFSDLSDNKILISSGESELLINSELLVGSSFWKGKLVLTNPNTNITTIIDNFEIIKILNGYLHGYNDNVLILNDRDLVDRYIVLYNMELNQIFHEPALVGVHRLTTNNYFIFSEFGKSSAINILNLKSKEFLNKSIKVNTWITSENQEKEGHIFQIIGIYNEELLIFIGKFRIISLDINTGEELWRIEDFLDEISSDKTLVFTKSKRVPVRWLFDKGDNMLYLLVRKYCFEVNIKDRNIKLAATYNDINDFELDFKKSNLYDDKITFSASNKLGGFPNVIGIINKYSKKIIWTFKSAPGRYFEEAPQLKDDKLYVLDNEKTLHIFSQDN